jgi:hypothetical protein
MLFFVLMIYDNCNKEIQQRLQFSVYNYPRQNTFLAYYTYCQTTSTVQKMLLYVINAYKYEGNSESGGEGGYLCEKYSRNVLQ